MRLRDLSLAICLVSAFGCSKPPEAVFVDINLIARQERPQSFDVPQYHPSAGVVIPAKTVNLPSSPGILILDRAEGKIEAARQLIQRDRELAIRTLSRRMAGVVGDEIEANKLRALEDFKRDQEALIRSVYGELFDLFEDYALARGPKVARKRLLQVRKPDLYVSRGNPTGFAEQQKAELAQVSEDIRTDDVEYDRQARQLLNEAELRLSGELGKIQLQFETEKANAIEKAQVDARQAIEKSGRDFNLNLGENKSVRVEDVPARSVGLPGATLSPPDLGPIKSQGRVVSDTERLKSLGQQLEIWLKTKGLVLSKSRSGVRDATAEFNEWRTTHQLGR